LSITTFHGDKRTKRTNDLCDVDIVLTTYATLVADRKGRKLLQKIAWFRVVLDEGS